jgi:hypothetical protein
MTDVLPRQHAQNDEIFLCRSFDVARRAVGHGNHPFGAILVDANRNVQLEADLAARRHAAKRDVAQDGKEVECKGGDHLADGHVLGMNFYVKGIDNKIPGK